MSLEEDLRARLTAAIKAKDLRTANVIRMLNTRIMERRTAPGFTGKVDDALVLDVIGAYRKSMEKAKTEFAAGGDKAREQIDQLQFEIDYCSQFLPTSLSEAELRAAVEKAVAELPSKDPKMAGRIVGAVKKQYGGRVDAEAVKKLAEELLSK
jgi:uncharacterized protein YqeY